MRQLLGLFRRLCGAPGPPADGQPAAGSQAPREQPPEPQPVVPGAASGPAPASSVSGARVFELACELLRAKTEALLARERRERDELDDEFQVRQT